MAGQNTFQIFLLSDANMIGEHYTANKTPVTPQLILHPYGPPARAAYKNHN